MNTSLLRAPAFLTVASIIASAVLSGLYARGGWLLGFVALVPWLLSLGTNKTLSDTLLSAWAMSVAFTAAVFAWFGSAIGSYTEVGAGVGLTVLIVCAPLFQPQFLVFALVRFMSTKRFGPSVGALAAAAAWVATERLVPKIFDDTLGYALYPSPLLRQAADLGGAPGLTVLLLLANEGFTAAIKARAIGLSAVARPLAVAAVIPGLLSGYGLFVFSADQGPSEKPLRVGLVQSNLVNYEQQRKQNGAYAVVRNVLDTHVAMTQAAVAQERVHAVLWSETAYPTTFGNPKSQLGADLDREILDAVNLFGVPLVFGTYDRDEDGEYNAAAFVEPGKGLLGFYRKTRLFPLTEYVPAWLDGPLLRRRLPWTGGWRPGNGARVFGLRLADGREVPVLASICLDDVDSALIIDGARLGAKAILTMSNDSWFTDYQSGAQMHQLVAAFRSIETRLPQFRVTSNGYSAVFDATGTVIASGRMGEQTLLAADVAIRTPPPTLMVLWGNWVGLAGAAFVLVLLAVALVAKLPAVRAKPVEPAHGAANSARGHEAAFQALPATMAVLSPGARVVVGLLRLFSRGALLWMGAMILLGAPSLQNTLAQIRFFAATVLAPEALAWCLLICWSMRAALENGVLVLTRRGRRFQLTLSEVARVEPWLLTLPGTGASLRLTSGKRWKFDLSLGNPDALVQIVKAANGTQAEPGPPSAAEMFARVRLSVQRGHLGNPLVKVVLLSLVLAIPAFLLHQNIAYGSAFGEYYTFGLRPYLLGFALWWAAWAISVSFGAAALRGAIEAGTLAGVLMQPAQATEIRRWLERLGLLLLYLGWPAWMLFSVFRA